MTVDIKEPGELEKELLKYSSKASPVIVLDTGGLIDIVHSTRNFGLNANGQRITHQNYTRATSFLKSVSSRIPILITPKTSREIQSHKGMWLNSHQMELTPLILDYSLDVATTSVQFVDRLVGETSLDDARYDAYWASLEGCNGNSKKQHEGCSDTDKEILSYAAYLTQCRHLGSRDNRINPVLVVSPDAHIICGAKLLRKGFDGKYSSIIPVSTRD